MQNRAQMRVAAATRLPPATSVPLAVHRLGAVALSVMVVWTGACRQGEEDRSVVPSENVSPSRPRVQSGAVYDTVEIFVDGARRFIVPARATVVKADVDHVRVHARKRLDFAGRPPRPINLATARRAMGLAVKRTETEVLCGTFGEWRNMEGSASIDLCFVVPLHVAFARREGLDGPNSVAGLHDPLWWFAHRQDDPSYWYAASVPADGWTLVRSQPDGGRRADSCP